MTTAFVLSGGGNLGAVQVGMLQALADVGMHPDLLVGTSAGALNAAFVAGHGFDRPSCDALADVWRQVRAHQLFRPSGASFLRGRALCSDHGIRALVHRHLTYTLLEEAPLPVHVIATDLLTGEEVVLREGSAVDAIAASCAIPGVFPPVPWHGRPLADGGLANNAALSQAVSAGADTVVVLPSGYACALPTAPRSVVGAWSHAISLLTHQRLLVDIQQYQRLVDLVVLAPPCPLSVPPLDFGRSAELVERGRACAAGQLGIDGGRRSNPGAHVAVHRHPSDDHRPAAVPEDVTPLRRGTPRSRRAG